MPLKASSLATIKTGLLASAMTALIWLWAEGESAVVRRETVPVVLPGADAELILDPEDDTWNREVRVRLEGPVSAIDAASGVLGRKLRLEPGMPGVPSDPGEGRVLDLREAVASLPDLRGVGASVAEVDPPTVVVRVVRMVQRELPVRVEFGRELALDGEPTTVPDRVSVRLPEAVSRGVPDSAAAVAVVSAEDLARLRTDGQQTVLAPVRLPPALDGVATEDVDAPRLTPDTVRVSFRVRRAVDTVTVPTVPVWFALPPTEDGSKWNVEVLDKFLTDVVVSGPSDDVARVRAGGLGIKAVVELSSDELQQGVSSKQAAIAGLPPSLTVTTPSRTVRLRITRQAPPAGNPAAAPGPVPAVNDELD